MRLEKVLQDADEGKEDVLYHIFWQGRGVLMRTEYEEKHIYGAVNIPVEVLREKCAGFDKSKKYITYCLNDSRGMVATFLLRNRGFDSKCLRGGVSGWEGEVVTGSDGVHMPAK